MTGEEVPYDQIWISGLHDQVMAAVEHNDWPTAARILVDGNIRAAIQDVRNGLRQNTAEGMLVGLSNLPTVLKSWCAAELLRRAVERELPQEQAP